MNLSELGVALRSYDAEALATLANPGLLRRARRDLEGGKIAFQSLADETAHLAVDGHKVSIDANGPQTARCDCPASGICRHRIAAVLFLQQAVEAVEAHPEQDQPTADPAASLAAISLDAARKFAGRAGWRAALELLDKVKGVERRDTSIAVSFDGLEGEVLILGGQGMGGIVSKAGKAAKKAYHAAAVIAARRHFGLPEEGLEEEPSPPGSFRSNATISSPDPAFLSQIESALAECTRIGFTLAPEALEETLFALSVSSRADALPRLAAILRGLAAQLRLKRTRALAFDAHRLLESLAIAHALIRAAAKLAPEDDGFVKIAGQVRREYHTVHELELVGCGADVWRTASGARGVTGHFVDPVEGKFYTASLARGAGQDPGFDPQLAYGQQALWQAAPLAVLAHARIRLCGVGVAGDGRLSAGSDVRAEIVERSVHPADAFAPIHHDWDELQLLLRERFGLGISADGQAQMILIAPADSGRPFFDELAQRLVWPVRDNAGRWLALTLDHDENASGAIERLESEMRGSWRGIVLLRAVQTGGRITLSPVTLFGKGIPLDLTVRSAQRGRTDEKDRLSWLRRLAPSRGQILVERAPQPSSRAIESAFSHVLDRLEAGETLARLSDDSRAAHAARLTAYGMSNLGALMQKAEAGAGALAAAYGLLIARQQRISLPWLD